MRSLWHVVHGTVLNAVAVLRLAAWIRQSARVPLPQRLSAAVRCPLP